MTQITLDSPFTVNPQQATKLVLRTATINFNARNVVVHVDLLDVDGRTLESRSFIVDGTQVQTWISNQEATIVNRLLAKLGVSGTVG